MANIYIIYNMENQTLSSFFGPQENNTEQSGEWYAGMAALVASIAAAIGSVIYASKHIKSSSCLGSRCEQEVVLEAGIIQQPRRNETNV